MVGPAVDEAAGFAAVAQAAVVCCAPSALDLQAKVMAPLGSHPLIRWRVPLNNNGEAYETFVVSPFHRESASSSRSAFWDALEPTFDVTVRSVEEKRQNTAEFVRHASAQLDEQQRLMSEFWHSDLKDGVWVPRRREGDPA
jgi:hypothetical protein